MGSVCGCFSFSRGFSEDSYIQITLITLITLQHVSGIPWDLSMASSQCLQFSITLASGRRERVSVPKDGGTLELRIAAQRALSQGFLRLFWAGCYGRVQTITPTKMQNWKMTPTQPCSPTHNIHVYIYMTIITSPKSTCIWLVSTSFNFPTLPYLKAAFTDQRFPGKARVAKQR